MTQPSPDDLPQGPYEVFKCDDERWGWDVEDKDGRLIAQNCTEQFARAIAAIPERMEQINQLAAQLIEAEKYSGWHQQAVLEIERLRTEKANLWEALEDLLNLKQGCHERAEDILAKVNETEGK
jgi:hypothetical protein